MEEGIITKTYDLCLYVVPKVYGRKILCRFSCKHISNFMKKVHICNIIQLLVFEINEFDSSRNLIIFEIRFNLALQFHITSYKSHYNDALLIFMTLILLSFYVIGLKAKFYKQMKTIGSRFFSHAMVGIHNHKSFYLHYIWSVKSRNT